ncbi:MAG: nicotinate phosphoribosyltransferase [Dehalococcoidia bacterium]|nr:nicotinate phosphoribosyltransferase [Dehalococcoidia bacterium]
MSWVNDANAPLLTDLYELTMAASYFAHGMDAPATFDLFVRKPPESRRFLIAAGLDDALHYLEHFRFDDDAVASLHNLGLFDEAFLAFLGQLRFTGDVWAISEGEAFFGDEPLLRVTAPLIEAQLVETFLLSMMNFQSLIASKAARVAIACAGREFVDFSARRDHGPDAALRAARASYIGGASATSNVLAGVMYGIPVAGTMAHSYVISFEHEIDAFRTFARDFPDRSILLIDTYDTLEGARRAAQVANELAPEGVRIQGVRLDSGDVAELAVGVRRILDENGCQSTRIFASGDLDEFRIAEIVARGAPIDAFGVGTQLGTSADAPALGGVYKLVEDSHGPKVKLSPLKITWPGRKQVYRFTVDGRYHHDLIALEDERVDGGRPLLRKVMANGRRVDPPEPLHAARERCRGALAALPERLRLLHGPVEEYRVDRSPGLRAAHESAVAHLRHTDAAP